MMKVKGKYNEAYIYTDHVDDATYTQVLNLCNQKWMEGNKIAIMPDCHAGSGCTIGTTIELKNGKVCPNLVGVDIGCGMFVVELPPVALDLKDIDDFINQEIPSGFDVNNTVRYSESDGIDFTQLHCYKALDNINRHELAVGSLGGGNHFIAIEGTDEHNYLIIHSGSRNLGVQIAKYYQRLAIDECHNHTQAIRKETKETIALLKKEGRTSQIQDTLKTIKQKYKDENIPDDLCYLSGEDAKHYLEDCDIAKHYASVSRHIMAKRILEHIVDTFVSFDEQGYTVQGMHYEAFETIHNYIDLDHRILRKGAISAQEGEKVIVPLNMRDGSLIALGKGNKAYNCSGPHGAGRILSRSQAKEQVDLDAFIKSMEGIYSTSVVASTVDESPFVYKPMNEIIENVKDSLNIVEHITPIYNFKAH